MAHTFMIFDFGTDEEKAQEARHKVEGWKQGFRLGNKLMVKFDRGDEKADEQAAGKDSKAGDAKKNALLVMVRLDFSDHEKLTHQRWLERIPTETLFKDAHPKIVRQGDQEFTSASERFEALD